MDKKLNDKYNPQDFEEKLYQEWEEKGYFKPSMDKTKESYCIMMPPPNVTGKLHMGHALDDTIQDILIRFKRMQGYNTLWLPGSDHAAIATEVKVVAKMKEEEGLTKADITREQFLERAWAWTKEYGGTIKKQQRRLGCSCDWDRDRFTMDEGLSEAVLEQFIQLYNKGLIYKGKKMINWCPSCHTTISDAEVEYEDEPSHLWHIRYQIAGEPDRYIIVATTRPETMLGDTAVAVHPDDERYKDLVGKKCILPIMNKEIPIIADEFVEKEFGTGCVKITPAHDPNDYQAGLRHNLEIIEVFDDSSIMGDLVPEYKGMPAIEARKLIVEKLQELGNLVKIEDYTHNVGKCYRCHSTIEPRISEQWFVSMKDLAKRAADAVRKTQVKFVPKRYEKMYFNWLDNIQDWCISRQLWWGHRIPVYYCDECGHIHVAKQMPEKCEKCGSSKLHQDEDSLDTWFSSALWPFSTLGWPNTESEDYKTFYPTNVLVTGYDIITFWVSRMMTQGLELTDKNPFKDVVVHGIVRDSQGRKMSKSLGNGVDPFDVVEKYGCDSLRYFLNTNSSPGLDLRYDETKIESSWNYLNKVWNISRYVMMNIDGYHEVDLKHAKLNLASRWILARLNQVIKEVDYNFDKYEFGEGNKALYNFVWNDFASWYVEISKVDLQSDDAENKNITQNVLVYVLMQIIKMLHPIVPFITEEIYQTLPHKEESITISSWPTVEEAFNDEEAINSLNIVMEIISAVRNERAKASKAPSAKINIRLEAKSQEVCDILNSAKPYLLKFTNPNELVITTDKANLENQVVVVLNDLTIYIPTNDLVDIEEVIKKLEGELKKLEGELLRSNNMLNNPNFVNKAPEAKIQAERDKKAMYEEKYNEVKAHLASIKK